MNKFKIFVLLACLMHVSFTNANENCFITKNENDIINHVIKSIELAETGVSKLNPEILKLEGMSSPKVRHFLNSICSAHNTSYLEIGCWKGSTWVSAMFGNLNTISSAIAIDDWSLFGGPYEEFQSNFSKFLPFSDKFQFFSNDCFQLNPTQIAKMPINIYFYDGDHSTIAHELAFTHYNSILDSVFIAIVDDWNFGPAQNGTRNAFEKLGYTILFERALPSAFVGDNSQWWNGIYVAVIRK